jgi:hypothetical protein
LGVTIGAALVVVLDFSIVNVALPALGVLSSIAPSSMNSVTRPRCRAAAASSLESHARVDPTTSHRRRGDLIWGE